MRQQRTRKIVSPMKFCLEGEKRTQIHLTGLDKGVFLPLPFSKFPWNGRENTHVTTTIKQERMWTADTNSEEFLDVSVFLGKKTQWKGLLR